MPQIQAPAYATIVPHPAQQGLCRGTAIVPKKRKIIVDTLSH